MLVRSGLVHAMKTYGPTALCWPGYFELPPEDGSDPSFVLPITDYQGKMHDLWVALGEAGYPGMIEGNLIDHFHERVAYDPLDIGMYSDAQITAVLRTIYLTDVFDTHHWADCLRSGLFTKIVSTVLTRLTYPDSMNLEDFVPKLGNRPYPIPPKRNRS